MKVLQEPSFPCFLVTASSAVVILKSCGGHFYGFFLLQKAIPFYKDMIMMVSSDLVFMEV